MQGDPKFEASQNLPRFDYGEYARMLGFEAVVMAKPADVGPGWDAAMAMSASRPVLVHAHVDPEVPPLPPHISFEQAQNFLSSMIKGDPHRWRMIKQSAKDLLR